MRPVSALRSTLSQPRTLMANQECHEPGPKLIFRSLLDSGASFPSLYRSDFEALGISSQQYGAQSVAHVLTANGEVERRIYELHVEIAGNDGTPIIDPESPVLPDFPRYIGGLSPVFYEDDEPLMNENGYETNGRLSGVMPFLAPYVSMTPAKNMILMGENRNDVLGSHKMPTQRRWQINFDQTPASREHWSSYQDPLITFSHRDGRFVDQDLAPAVTRVALNIGLPNESFHVFDARGDYMMDSYIQDPDAALNQEDAQ